LPWAIACGIVALALLASVEAPPWLMAVAALLALAWCVAVRRRDAVTRAVVLMYDMDDAAQEACSQFHAAFETLQVAARVWHVSAAAAVRDRKYHAGAGNVVKRTPINIRIGEPPILKTNVDAVLIPAGHQLLAFMPDRLLVFERGAVAGIDYRNLTIDVIQTRFIEEDPPQ
jgi:hypothetical protein